jgi:hypothetical protein
VSELKDSKNRSQHMFQSVESVHNNEIFYSINESKHEEMMESIKEQREAEKIAKNQIEDEEILMPEF